MSGRTTSPESYILTPEQIDTFHKEGCVTLPNVLTEEEVIEIEKVFDQFLKREIHVPGKDFCDMSKVSRELSLLLLVHLDVHKLHSSLPYSHSEYPLKNGLLVSVIHHKICLPSINFICYTIH